MRKSTHNHLPHFLVETIRTRHTLIKTQLLERKGAAFFDFDGSLIDGDITEGKRKGESLYSGLVDRAILAGLFPGFQSTEGLRNFWRIYEAFGCAEEAYLWVDRMVSDAGKSKENQFRSFVAHHLKDIVGQNLFSFAKDLLEFCSRENIEPFVVSASPHFFVEQLAGCLNIAPANLFGVCADHITHNREGKARRMKELCDSRGIYPVMAMGNKWQWDGLMIQRACEEGGVGILVNEGAPENYEHEFLYCLDIL